jgi:hypothetical protein
MGKTLVALATVVILSSCSKITIQPESGVAVRDTPSYQDSRNFFFWGLAGEERVNVSEICKDKAVAQMQSQATFENGFFTVITLGIYAPHSVLVWCEDAILNKETA